MLLHQSEFIYSSQMSTEKQAKRLFFYISRSYFNCFVLFNCFVQYLIHTLHYCSFKKLKLKNN